MYKVAFPPSPWGDRSKPFGKKIKLERREGEGKRDEGKGRGKKVREDGIWEEEGRGDGRRREREGRQGAIEEKGEREMIENRIGREKLKIEKWEVGEGNQVSAHFIHPCF